MEKRAENMKKAFVFGKFYPFHKGHEAMINYALGKCDFLTVVICSSNKEKIPGNIRKSWIEETFIDIKNIEVVIFNYSEEQLPNTSVSSKKVSEIWAREFRYIVPEHKLLITSEPYGEYVAEYMEIEHLPFDFSRQNISISATTIREDLFTNWKYLPNSVKPYFTIKTFLLGTESTGKTTLTDKLATYFNCSKVSEAGRDIIENSKTFDFLDLYSVIKEHTQRIETAVRGDSPLVIIDTDIHITKSYGRFIFNKELQITEEVYASNQGHLYLYLNNDVEYVQDGTRLEELERNKLDITHRKVLKEYSINYTEITGDWEDRYQAAIERIKEYIQLSYNFF